MRRTREGRRAGELGPRERVELGEELRLEQRRRFRSNLLSLLSPRPGFLLSNVRKRKEGFVSLPTRSSTKGPVWETFPSFLAAQCLFKTVWDQRDQ